MWLYALAFLVLAAAGALGYGRFRWRTRSAALETRIRETAAVPPPGPYRAEELAGLPEPVQRYFRAVLREGDPRVIAVHIDHAGTFNLGEKAPNWRPFHSHQFVSPYPPQFDWDARVSLLPGVDAFVHDAYAGGEGLLHVEALGLVPMVDLHDTPEIAVGELQRYLAEGVWHPYSLLPAAGVEWTPIDAESARATLRCGKTVASLIFHFDVDGLVTSVRAEERFRMVDGVPVATPWEGTFRDYHVRQGMLVPLEGEVAWILPEGRWPYWRGRIEKFSCAA